MLVLFNPLVIVVKYRFSGGHFAELILLNFETTRPPGSNSYKQM